MKGMGENGVKPFSPMPLQLFVVGFNQQIHALLLLLWQFLVSLQQHKFFIIHAVYERRRKVSVFL